MTFIDIFTDSLLAIEYYYQYNNRWKPQNCMKSYLVLDYFTLRSYVQEGIDKCIRCKEVFTSPTFNTTQVNFCRSELLQLIGNFRRRSIALSSAWALRHAWATPSPSSSCPSSSTSQSFSPWQIDMRLFVTKNIGNERHKSNLLVGHNFEEETSSVSQEYKRASM